MPTNATYQGTKCSGGSIDLVVMGRIGKCTELIDKCLLPITRDQLDETMLALCGCSGIELLRD